MPNKVTTREIGSIPHCKPAEPSFRQFDAYKYWSSVNEFCRQSQRTIRHMEKVRAGQVQQPEIAS